ncbi:hypothetical protein ACHQM5_015243 [Ranunculus cassubicifolius]
MSITTTFGRKISRNVFQVHVILRFLCSGNMSDNVVKNGSGEKLNNDSTLGWKPFADEPFLRVSPEIIDDDEEISSRENMSPRRRFFEEIGFEVDSVIKVLQQDGPGFNTDLALKELKLRVSNHLVREVLLKILKSINCSNRVICAKVGYKFFVWSSQQINYTHTSSTYNLLMKIFADCEEYKAMWRLVDVMTEEGFATTARTFHILICTCGEAGLARKLVERFIKSKTFNFRPFKHSFNAILHSLLTINQYRLIEWVYDRMTLEEHSPDILTYNILMCTKYRLGKLDQFYRLLDEMCKNGFSPDLHTYNILLHVLGGGDKPLKALNLMNHMKEVGCEPRIIHFTSLIDGLSRAGNLEACKYFFDEMVKQGCMPDVVCYTVMITGYVVAREFEKAQMMFDDMITKGQLPNAFTYNAMIRGLCIARKFEEARAMLREMDSRGCPPNYFVYSTLVSSLRKAGMLSAAREVIGEMVEKGYNMQTFSKFKGYWRC